LEFDRGWAALQTSQTSADEINGNGDERDAGRRISELLPDFHRLDISWRNPSVSWREL